jgi:hypothetical protein
MSRTCISRRIPALSLVIAIAAAATSTGAAAAPFSPWRHWAAKTGMNIRPGRTAADLIRQRYSPCPPGPDYYIKNLNGTCTDMGPIRLQ